MSWLTLYGVAALTFMLIMYGLERRGAGYILGFALGCALSSAYGFLAGAWPFGVVEAVWCLIALRRYVGVRAAPPGTDGEAAGMGGRSSDGP